MDAVYNLDEAAERLGILPTYLLALIRDGFNPSSHIIAIGFSHYGFSDQDITRLLALLEDSAPEPISPHERGQDYSIAELAHEWNLSEDRIRSLCQNETGVFIIARPATCGKRGYHSFRIPEAVAERIHKKLAVK